MTKEKAPPKEPLEILDNWTISEIFVDAEELLVAPILSGYVDGKRIKADIVLWFDVDEKIIMTIDKIFTIGAPNVQWMTKLLNAGHCPHDLEIKATLH